ncbi:MAG: hypothetical protein VX948_00975 [Candidatus Latescibacterota bacterium]|nr:hypothetical protein [Candidatus Latescibacterota bacterium]
MFRDIYYNEFAIQIAHAILGDGLFWNYYSSNTVHPHETRKQDTHHDAGPLIRRRTRSCAARLKSAFRRRAVRCEDTSVYITKGRSSRLRQLPVVLRDAAALLGDQVDHLIELKLRWSRR